MERCARWNGPFAGHARRTARAHRAPRSPPPAGIILTLFVQVALIIALSRAIGYLFGRMRQPQVMGEMVAGILLGRIPSFAAGLPLTLQTSFVVALILSLFAVIFGARRLVSSERHEGLVAAIAFESLVKLTSFLLVGIFVTYVMFDGVTDIFDRMRGRDDVLFHLTTFGGAGEISYPNWFATLYLSAGAILRSGGIFLNADHVGSDSPEIQRAWESQI